MQILRFAQNDTKNVLVAGETGKWQESCHPFQTINQEVIPR